MSEFVEQKRAFHKAAVDHGIGDKSELRGVFPLGVQVPEKKLIKWLEKLGDLPGFSSQRRYVNRFKLGADPEFVLTDPKETIERLRIDAGGIGLAQGLAFGADNNGRLAELRPAPSRSAVRVCASVMNTLRWMALLKPQTLRCDWLAGAYICGDGVGGHVHFGRKRPTRGIETNALDALSDILLALNVFPVEEVNARRRGDRLHQLYGHPGDIRLQTHGYEYRTFPSWLDSPSLAFLVLTLAKLAVHSPEVLLGLPSTKDPKIQFRRLYNFLALYKESDDDALLACYMLKRGLPGHTGVDFKGNWGVSQEKGSKDKDFPVVSVVPSIIPGTEEDYQEMFNHLLRGGTMSKTLPRPSWEPLTVPSGYEMVINRTGTILQKGLGEIVWDLCSAKEIQMGMTGIGRSAMALIVGKGFPVIKNWKKLIKVPVCFSSDMDGRSIAVPINWREGEKAKQVKAALLSGAFPIWKVSKVQKSDYEEWVKKGGSRGGSKYPLSKVLFQSPKGQFIGG